MKIRQQKLLQACSFSVVLLATVPYAFGGINVTPGSASDFVFFPPSNGAGAGGEGGNRSEALERCVYFVSRPDVSFTLNKLSFYTLESIRLYYMMVGGDGGPGVNGGGGGSSAFIYNGTPTIAPGGNGGQPASIVRGELLVKPNDTIRVVTGGGGGAGVVNSSGGGGGAGWTGGGAGGSLTGGKGGAASPGAAGTGGPTATAGSGHYGGINGWDDGNTTPVGVNSGNLSFRVKNTGIDPQSIYRQPATPLWSGSPAKPIVGNSISGGGRTVTGGGGGAWGHSGTGPVDITYVDNFSVNRGGWYRMDNKSIFMSNGQTLLNASTEEEKRMSNISMYPDTGKFELTRKRWEWQMSAPGLWGNTTYWQIYDEGGISGQIVMMYNAPDCTLLDYTN